MQAVESEFQMCYPDDNTRLVQILQEETFHKDHIFNRFLWGNLVSLRGEDEATLWDDLKAFYEEHYSAERVALVVQVKTRDHCKELSEWIKESFKVVPNRQKGI